MTSDDAFRQVRERIRELCDSGAGALGSIEAADLEKLAAVCDGQLGFDDLDDATYRRLIDSLGLEGVTELLVPREVLAVAAGRLGPFEPSRAFASGWPDLDEALGRQFAMPRFLPPAPVEAQHDLPFDVGPGRVQDGGIVEAVLWTVSEGSAPILVHRHRIAGEAVARAWTFYLPEDDAPQSRMHPRGLWGAPDAEGYRFDLLVHRKRSGALLLGAAGEDGLLHRLWIVPAEDGVVRSGWIRGPGGRWTEESVEGRHLLDERVWTERQRSAALTLRWAVEPR